jgi:hypothetical protein
VQLFSSGLSGPNQRFQSTKFVVVTYHITLLSIKALWNTAAVLPQTTYHAVLALYWCCRQCCVETTSKIEAPYPSSHMEMGQSNFPRTVRSNRYYRWKVLVIHMSRLHHLTVYIKSTNAMTHLVTCLVLA